MYNRMEQRLSQKLSISNKVVQSLKILNMGRQELEGQLEAVSESNPLLDVDINNNEVDWEKYFRNEKFTHMLDKNEAAYADDSEYDFENMTKSEDTLYDSLYAQVCILKITPEMKATCRYLIDSLDKDGYLRDSEESLLKDLKIEQEELEAGIKVIQSLEPAGIGARNLAECIILQLHDYNVYEEALEELVKNDLNLVANSNVAAIASKYGLERQKVVEYIEFIKTLDPKPASKFANEDIQYAYPDVVVEKVDGKFVAKPYNEKRAKIGINTYYKNLLLTTEDEETKKYITERLNSAQKIINDVGERSNTIVNITNEIIKVQYDFFENEGNLKPLTMGDIADILECHVSTISRGVNDKYMLTDKGMYELKFFFAKAVGEDSNLSNLSVKDEIKAIIEAEDKKKPLSDKKIEDALRSKGIEIARRTVAKYREELGYLSSSKRKEI